MINRNALLPLALLVQAALPAAAAESTDLQTPRPGVVCQAGTTICRSREQVTRLGSFKLGRSLLCDSHLGLCWQQQGTIRTVNWRVSRELYGSTSPGTGWGDWHPQQATLPLRWQAQCQLHRQSSPPADLLYAGPCTFNESLEADTALHQTSSPIRALEVRLGETTLRFLWKDGRYHFASGTTSAKTAPTSTRTAPASQQSAASDAPLSLQDQGSRAVLRWASFQLLTARTPEDLSVPAIDEALKSETLDLSTHPHLSQP